MINKGYGGTWLKPPSIPEPPPPSRQKLKKTNKYEILLKEIIKSEHESISIDTLHDMYSELKSEVDIELIIKRYLK